MICGEAWCSVVVRALVAQWIARWTSNPKVVGSSPTWGVMLAAVDMSVQYVLSLIQHSSMCGDESMRVTDQYIGVWSAAWRVQRCSHGAGLPQHAV